MPESDDRGFLHSKDCLNDWRDSWWNRDFLELMARRWRLAEVDRALDVGSGLGHWGLTLLPLLSASATMVGVDKEGPWVEGATERAEALELSDRVRYVKGRVEALPFESDHFGLVTCQTVLMHVKDPPAAIQEMIRVLKPGGLLAVSEPNNLANLSFGFSAEPPTAPEIAGELISFQLRIEAGRRTLGHGDSSIGERVPGLFAQAGLTDIRVFGSDKCATLIPPYASPAEQQEIAQRRTFFERGLTMTSGDETHTRECFIAGGGTPEAFDALWATARAHRKAHLDALDHRAHSASGGFASYLISARKPAGTSPSGST